MTETIAKMSFKKRQVGAVNTIMIALMGVGLMATTAVSLNAIRSSQDQQLSLHANTQSTSRAWDGVELIRIYLSSLSSAQITTIANDLQTLPNGKVLAIAGVSNISATVISVGAASASGVQKITANITGSGANTAVTIQTVYALTPATTATGTGTTPPRLAAVNINGTLNLTGNVSVLGSSSANLMVNGDVNLSGSVSGINEICSTGNVAIGSNITVNHICTNGNLTLSGSANVLLADVVGNVYLDGGSTSISTINSNGTVTLSGGGASAGTITTKKDVSITGGNAAVTGALNTEGSVNWTSSSPASTINANQNVAYTGRNNATTINSRGTTTLSGNGDVQTLNALGLITLNSGYGLGVQGQLQGGSGLTFTAKQKVFNGVVAGTISGTRSSAYDPVMNVRQDPNFKLTVTAVNAPVIQTIIAPNAVVDVYKLKSSANYVFEIEASTGYKVVTVQNVSSIASGRYYIGNYAGGNKDYLCTAVISSGICTAPVTPYKTLCQGQSANNGCFTYASNTWSVSGDSMAPGFAYFDGNLAVGNGTYLNTFAATGNISTSGNTSVYSPNYVGYTGICTDNRTAQNSLKTDSRLSGIYPSDLCKGSSYSPSTIANVALIAGGYLNGSYVGGNIDVGSSNSIFGSVIAGNLLSTSGNTSIVGSVQVANQLGGSSATTTMQGSTTIDLRNLPSTFDPTASPCMSSSCQASSATPGATKTYWTRYL